MKNPAFARFLGEGAASLTDSQLQQLHQEMRELAELLLDFYCWKESTRIKRAREDRACLDTHGEDSRIGTSSQPMTKEEDHHVLNP